MSLTISNNNQMESLSTSLLNPCSSFLHHHQIQITKTILHLKFNPTYSSLRPQSARRIIPTSPQEDDNLVNPRTGLFIGNYYRDNFNIHQQDHDLDDDDDDDDDQDQDRSLDLLVRFLENVFKKISRKARKAIRSVLPINISAKLVRFSVNGSLILTFLWVLKAFLEVVCTLGSIVFISILVIRGVWTGISHFQENRYYRRDGIDDLAWSSTRPAA